MHCLGGHTTTMLALDERTLVRGGVCEVIASILFSISLMVVALEGDRKDCLKILD